jgi:hypothetical protein
VIPRRIGVVVLCAAVVLGATIAFASSLVVTAKDITVASTSVSVPKSVVTITQSAVGGAPNTAHTTTATLSGGTASAVGSLTFTLFPGSACSGTAVAPGAQTIDPINGAAGQTYTSAGRTPTSSGTYSWLASYAGDANNNAATNCTSITVAATAQLHVSAITLVSKANQNVNFWNATIKVEVRDGAGTLISGVSVTGSWSPTSANSSCSPTSAGTCNIASGNTAFPAAQLTETWTVSNLTLNGSTYNAAANSLSSIVVTKP